MKSLLFAIFFCATAVLSVNAGDCSSCSGGSKEKTTDKTKDSTKQNLVLVPDSF
jgi:hypothetical protein